MVLHFTATLQFANLNIIIYGKLSWSICITTHIITMCLCGCFRVIQITHNKKMKNICNITPLCGGSDDMETWQGWCQKGGSACVQSIKTAPTGLAELLCEDKLCLWHLACLGNETDHLSFNQYESIYDQYKLAVICFSLTCCQRLNIRDIRVEQNLLYRWRRLFIIRMTH